MPLRTKAQSVTFDDIDLVATANLTRTVTRTVIDVLALVIEDASPFHIDSDADEARQDANETQAVGARTFVSAVLGTQSAGPVMNIIGQDLCIDGTITVGDKLTATVTTKEKRKKDVVVLFSCSNRERVAATYDTGETSR